jgi:hypothetical protein
MVGYKPIYVPLDQNGKWSANVGEVLEDATMYRKIVGSLIYMTITRLDLNYTVGLESQFMQVFRKPHLDGVRHTLRYVSATVDYGLFYEASTKLQVHGYIDADWAGSILDMRSTSSFMFSFGSVVVMWSSKKQLTVALSSTKAEYMGAAMVACEVAWFRKLLEDLGLHVDRHVIIYCDNLSSIQLAKNPMFYARTEYVEVHYHFIREKVLAGEIDLIYVNTEDQVADIFTKVLGAE